MSLRWSSYVAPKSHKGGLKNAKRPISVKKLHFAWRKSGTKFLSVKTVSGRVIRHSLAWLTVQKWLVGATPSTRNSGSKWPRWSEIADFRYLFSCSDSALTPNEKSLINVNSKSTTRFPMTPRWTLYVVPKPQRVARKRKVSEIWTISCDNSETVRDRMSVRLLLITNRESHTGYRLVPTSMTLNDLERRNSLYFAFYHRIRQIFRPIYHSGWR